MEGRPRRGRRRRQSQDQAPAQHQGTVPTPEQTPIVGPPEDAPPPQAKEMTVTLPPEEPAAQPSPAAPYAEEVTQPQTMDQPPLAPPQVVQTAAPPAHRGDHRQAAGHPKGQQRDQRDHARGDQAREGRGDQARGGDQVRGDQKGDQGRRLQDSIVATWSIPIRMDSEIRRIEDTLRGIRKALEDECMIGQDDASERVLLDLALNAIRDRITIHRIQPVTRDLDETERLLRLRQQADRHVVEMLTALKSV